jgi:hypothetical protein
MSPLFGAGTFHFCGPLFLFTPGLVRLKHEGLLRYGVMAGKYTRLFDAKWIQKDAQSDESSLGSSEIQSLADLGQRFELVRKIKLAPVERGDFLAFALPGLIPVLPLIATVMPITEILKGLLHLIA